MKGGTIGSIFLISVLFLSFAITAAGQTIEREPENFVIQRGSEKLRSSIQIFIVNETSYNWHEPIVINSEIELLQFVAQDGLNGSGTANDPFIITSLNLSMIQIFNTRSFIRIEKNNLYGNAPYYSSLISLQNTSNVEIVGNSIETRNQTILTIGIYIFDSSNINITMNQIYRLDKGIELIGSQMVSVSRNAFFKIGVIGMKITASNQLMFKNNRIQMTDEPDTLPFPKGINIDSIAYATFLNNSIQDASSSIIISYSHDILFKGFNATITDNKSTERMYGKYVAVKGVISNVTFAEMYFTDARPRTNDPYEWQRSLGLSFIGLELYNVSIIDSEFDGVRRAVELGRSIGENISFIRSKFINLMGAIGIWFNQLGLQNIVIKESIFAGITGWEPIKIGDLQDEIVKNVTIEGNQFYSTTNIFSDIALNNVHDARIIRNNFLNRYGAQRSNRPVLTQMNSANITAVENYYSNAEGIDADRNGFLDQSYSVSIDNTTIDPTPSARMWPSARFPFEYLPPSFQSPRPYETIRPGQQLSIIWYHATDTQGTQYSYNLYYKLITGSKALLLDNITRNFVEWSVPTNITEGKYTIILEITNMSKNGTMQVVSTSESSFFTIETGQNDEPTTNTENGDGTSTDDRIIPETISPPAFPLGNDSSLVYLVSTIGFLVITQRKRKSDAR